MVDFSVDDKKANLHLAYNQYKLKSLSKDHTCFKKEPQ